MLKAEIDTARRLDELSARINEIAVVAPFRVARAS
jgi:hypothetical protein